MSGEEDIAAVMGFSGFGSSKKSARVFDVEEMFKKTQQTAREYSAQVKAKQGETSDKPHPLEDDDDDEVGPPLPPGYNPAQQEGEDSDMEEEREVEQEEFDSKIPLSQQITLQHGIKPVSALGLDPAGSRLLTGGYDYDVKFWDFAGMDSTLKSFRTIQPCESHQICSLQYSNNGEMILVASGNAQAKVLDRDGVILMDCPKGWQYIADMANTNGHISMINNACWHPRIREEFVTCSNDCTLRIWDAYEEKKQKHIVKARDRQGKKIAVTTCTYTKDGKMLVGGMRDGSIQLWKSGGPFVRPSIINYKAHESGQDISCICVGYDNQSVLSRGCDETLKLWDLRKFNNPVATVTGLPNFFSVTDCTFSPNQQLIVTGTSVRRNKGSGELIFYDRSLNEVYKHQMEETSVVRCLWHHKLNQIIVGCGDGNVHMFFSDKYSSKGATLCAYKQKKRTKIESFSLAGPRVITPHALPMFRDDDSKSLKRKRDKERKDPILSKQPELPVTGKGVDGRVSAGGGSSIGAYMRKVAALERAVDKDEDPREAVLKYAKVAAESPFYINPAYKESQPKPVFQEKTTSDDEEET